MKDNYARNVSLSCLLIIVLIGAATVLISYLIYITQDERLKQIQTNNLIEIYGKWGIRW